MAIEIKELVIRANIRDDAGGGGGGLDAKTRQQVVKECVDQVMELLKEREER